MSRKAFRNKQDPRKSDVEITLHKGQFEVFWAPQRFKVLVCGRRWGKTELSRSLIKYHSTKRTPPSVPLLYNERDPKSRLIYYVGPTYRQAKSMMWRELKDSIPKDWVIRSNETMLEIDLINNTRIALKGAEDPDYLRGVGLDYVVFDEVQKIDPYAWDGVVAPMLSTTGGGAAFIGTPDSYGFLYDLYQRGQSESEKRQWKSWQFVTADSPFVPQGEVEQQKRHSDPRLFQQEYMATFLSMTGKVYHQFDRETHVGFYPFNENLPIWICQDFNVNPMSTAICQYQPDTKEVWVVDEIHKMGSNVEEVCDEIERRYWRHIPDSVVFPDPAGGQKQHARGDTSIDIFMEKGFEDIRYKRQHPLVRDRVNCVNRMLCNAAGDVKFRVNSTCNETIKSFERTMWKEDKPEIEKKNGAEHMSDGIGYMIEYMFPLRSAMHMGVSI